MAGTSYTKGLVAYTAGSPPNLPGSDARFYAQELRNISTSIQKLIAVMQQLEARMNADGLA